MDMRCGEDAFKKSVLRKNEITIPQLLAGQRTLINLPPHTLASIALCVSGRRWRGYH
jgi:hypothetical protein